MAGAAAAAAIAAEADSRSPDPAGAPASPRRHVRQVSSSTVFTAIAKGGFDKLLEDANPDCIRNVRDWQQRTALIKAAELGNATIVGQLISLGVDITATDVFGFTALGMACHKAHPDCVTTLLAAGASVGTPAQDGDTPLHLAAAQSEQHPEAAAAIGSALLAAGADPLARNASDSTPARACTGGKGSLGSLLLEAEAAALARLAALSSPARSERDARTLRGKGTPAAKVAETVVGGSAHGSDGSASASEGSSRVASPTAVKRVAVRGGGRRGGEARWRGVAVGVLQASELLALSMAVAFGARLVEWGRAHVAVMSAAGGMA